jgi:hypothetical protein
LNRLLNGYGVDRGIEVLKKHHWLITEEKRNKKLHRINSKSERFYTVQQTNQDHTLIVTVYTPNGQAMQVLAKDQTHADFLIRMNSPPKSKKTDHDQQN